MDESTSTLASGGAAPKSAAKSTPVVKNDLEGWDFMADMIYSDDFKKVFPGPGKVVGWALTSQLATEPHMFNIVLSGPRSKSVYNYSVHLGGTRATSFSSMKSFYKKMKSHDKSLPNVLLPQDVALLWERVKNGEPSTILISMERLENTIRGKVTKGVEGAELLLEVFEHVITLVTPTAKSAITAEPKKRKTPSKKSAEESVNVDSSEGQTAGSSTSSPKVTNMEATKKRKRSNKKVTVEDTSSKEAANVPETQPAETSPSSPVSSTPPRKKSKTTTRETRPLAASNTSLDAAMMELMTKNNNSIVAIESSILKSMTELNDTSSRILEVLSRLEAAKASPQVRNRSKRREEESSDESESDHGSSDEDDFDGPASPLSPRADSMETVEKSNTGRPLRQARKKPLVKNADIDLAETLSEDEKEMNDDEDPDYEKIMNELVGRDTDPEIDEVDDEGDDDDEDDDDDDDDDMEVDSKVPPEKLALMNASNVADLDSDDFADSSPENAMDAESSMEDKVYNDDNDTLGEAPRKKNGGPCGTQSNTPLPKKNSDMKSQSVNSIPAPKAKKDATSGQKKKANPLPTISRPSLTTPAKTNALSSSSKPFHLLSSPSAPSASSSKPLPLPSKAVQAPPKPATCDDVINGVEDDEFDSIDM